MWLNEWRAISARISGLHDAADFATAIYLDISKLLTRSQLADTLITHAESIRESLNTFRDRYRLILPDRARSSLEQLLQRQGKLFGLVNPDQPIGLFAAISLLLAFRAEFDYLVSDDESVTKSLVARAFVHLQSSIAADRKVRGSWIEAFEDGETACERLGASHLMLHGVWSFKASTEHARTDLLLSEPRTNWDEPQRAAQGLVLTEWKRVTAEDAEKKSYEAFKQANIYSEEPLAGFEVASTRYLILVSRKRLSLPSNITTNNVTYEYRNVAVEPDVPSIEARKAEGRDPLN